VVIEGHHLNCTSEWRERFSRVFESRLCRSWTGSCLPADAVQIRKWQPPLRYCTWHSPDGSWLLPCSWQDPPMCSPSVAGPLSK